MTLGFRAYTLEETDKLRLACRDRALYGTTKLVGSRTSRSYREQDLQVEITQLMRQYMLAGITADDIYRADNNGY